jgi:hypothetical protein
VTLGLGASTYSVDVEPEDALLGNMVGEGVEEVLDMDDVDEVVEVVADAVVEVRFVVLSETTK